jgi:hypothetical protein
VLRNVQRNEPIGTGMGMAQRDNGGSASFKHMVEESLNEDRVGMDGTSMWCGSNGWVGCGDLASWGRVGGFELGVETSGRTLESPRGSTLPHSQGGN